MFLGRRNSLLQALTTLTPFPVSRYRVPMIFGQFESNQGLRNLLLVPSVLSTRIGWLAVGSQ
jgi:hypothetical protein